MMTYVEDFRGTITQQMACYNKPHYLPLFSVIFATLPNPLTNEGLLNYLLFQIAGGQR